MYLSFYGLNKKPFQISSDPQFLWLSENHKEALAMLAYGIMDNRGFLVLTGDVGTGKTTLINALKAELMPNVLAADISNPGLEKIEFFNYLGAIFDLKTTFTNKNDFLLSFREFLERSYRNGNQVLLIIDEAQRLSQEMLEEIRLLSNIDHQDVKLLNIFFVGQDEFNDILNRNENRALRQRMTLQYHLEPLAEQEIGLFIEHRLKIAGTEKRIFTREAIDEIYAFSKGYPRLINIICDFALLAGYAATKKEIGVDLIKDCANDLKLPRNNVSQPPEKTRHASERSSFSMLPYITGFLFAILMIFLLYFPMQAGVPLSDIPKYYIGLMYKSNFATSKTTLETFEPIVKNSQVASEVKPKVMKRSERREYQYPEGNDTEIPDNREIEKLSTEEADGPESADVTMPEDLVGIEPKSSALKPSIPTASNVPSFQSLQPSGASTSEPFISEDEKHYSIAFNFASNDLTPDGYEQLDKTAAIMKDQPNINIVIQGHTDAFGSKTYNTMLSKSRADQVKNYLVAKGVASERITTIGRGAEEPLANNDDPAGRKVNRRAEIEMVFK